MTSGPITITAPKLLPSNKEKVDLLPQWNVLLFNDDDHTYEYVIEMIVKIFGHSAQKAMELALQINDAGQAIADTTSKERAELKQEQVHAFGPDWRMGPGSDGPIKCEIVPTE